MSSDCLQNADKIRILVLGDSGVGKTSLVELLCSGTELRKPRSTVGCAIHMKIHESPSTVAPAPVCGSCPSHALSCGVAAGSCSAVCSCCALDTRANAREDNAQHCSSHQRASWLDAPRADYGRLKGILTERAMGAGQTLFRGVLGHWRFRALQGEQTCERAQLRLPVRRYL